MTRYRFKVLTHDDLVLEGSIEAPSLHMARRRLEADYARVTLLEEAPDAPDQVSLFVSRIPKDMLAVYTRQLAVLLRSGINLTRATEVLAQGESERLNTLFLSVGRDLEKGLPLSKSLKRFPQAFNRLYVTLIEAAETSGKLEANLNKLTDIMEKSVRLQKKVAATFAYPSIVLLISMLVLGVFVFFVMPTIVPTFEQIGVALPLCTRLVLAFTRLVSNPVAVLGAAAAAWIGLQFLRRWALTRPGRVAIQDGVRRIHLIGPTLVKRDVSYVLYIIQVMMDSGIPIGEAIQVAQQATGSARMELGLHRARKLMEEGQSLRHAFATSGCFPSLVMKLVTVGEEVGRLPAMLRVACDLYEEEIDQTLATLATVLEPLVLIVVGLLVGFVTLAAFMPSVSLMQNM